MRSLLVMEVPLKFTKAKATMGAVTVFFSLLTAVLADEVVNVGEVGALVSGAVVGVVGVWGIWRVPNKVITESTPDRQYSL